MKPPRLHLKCDQCGSEIVLPGAQTEWFKGAYTVSLCGKCAPSLHQKCGAFLFPAADPKAARPLSKPDHSLDPARMITAKKVAEDIAYVLWRSAAAGDEHAALMLTELTCSCVNRLHNLAECLPGVLRPTAQTMDVWPYLISKKKRFQTIGKRLLDKLEVGTKPVLNARVSPE